MGGRNVLERILSGLEEPTNLSLSLLQDITDNFSEARKIGEGGFGVVYKIINHPNVVRFLGFCYEICHAPYPYARSEGFVLAQIRERLLCFEHICNGSLDKHITDELRGLEWDKRFQIIKGICQGLQYLHNEKHIIHMDLKPANIMLNDEMAPKITDFGLSRPDKNTHTTGILFQSRGYCAPEYENGGKMSIKADMYSLGVIITELVTGRRTLPTNNHDVLRRWRHRWNKPPTLLQYQQVTVCVQIVVSCRKSAPDDRPFIWNVIGYLDEVESENRHIAQTSLYSDDDMLRIEPLNLHFPFKLNNEISCLIELTNKTKNCFAFNIQTPSMQYSTQPEKGVVRPGCKNPVKITLQPQERVPHATQNFEELIVQSTNVKEGLTDADINQHMFNYKAGKVIDEVNLRVVFEPEKSQVDLSFKRQAEEERTTENLEGATNDLLLRGDNVHHTNESADKNIIVGQRATKKSAEDCNLQEALHFIRDDPVGVIGIWGPGGVGKTYLLNNIDNSLRGNMVFDNVIHVTASKGCSVERIQDDILRKLNLMRHGNVDSQRCIIFDFLEKKSFLVLLDDLWDQIDLQAVGIPYPLGSANKIMRKVVLTTRLRKVCGQMEVRKEFKIACLQEAEAWQLFQDKIGHETLSYSIHIEALAKELVKEMKGLPLALITIGRAMYGKTDTAEWEYAIQHMKQSCCDNDDPLDMERTVFRQIKFSYDSLRNDTLRHCFSTCALWPEDCEIRKEELARCWIGLGLVGERDIQSSYIKAYSLMGDLMAACLIDVYAEGYDHIKLHDVVRDMALWISCGCGENNDRWVVHAGVGMKKIFSIPWSKAEYISLMRNQMMKLPPLDSNPCQMKLRMLCLARNQLNYIIVAEATRKFTALTYLDLESNSLDGIPEELCSLANLEHLNLSRNYIKEVPHCFGNLIKLKFLYLEETMIKTTPKGVISSLKALQLIDLRTLVKLDGKFVSRLFRELGTLHHMKTVGISILDFAQYESLRKAANLPMRYLHLQSLNTYLALSDILPHDFARRTLYELRIVACRMEQIIVRPELARPANCSFGTLRRLILGNLKKLREVTFTGTSPASLFPRLTCLKVGMCNMVEDLSWAMYLPCLEKLRAYDVGVRQAFTSHHGDNKCTGQESSKTFPCLKYLKLSFCRSLVSIGDPNVTFPSLERLKIKDCKELKRLPFQMHSLPSKLRVIEMDVESEGRLELEQDVKSFVQTRLKFQPY